MAFAPPLHPTLSRTSTFTPSVSLSRHHPHAPHHRRHFVVHPRSPTEHPSRNAVHVRVPRMAASVDRILWATNLSKSYDGRVHQLHEESLTLHRGDKVAILGPNGSGKSTLLSILAGLATPDNGSVTLRKGSVIAHVAQALPTDLDPALSVSNCVLQLAARHSPTPDIRAALRHATAVTDLDQPALQPADKDRALQKLSDAVVEMDARPGAWLVDSFLSTVLKRLDLQSSLHLSSMSGGQKRRVAIAAALVAQPHILLLDEVTNHLSISGIEFLEDVLSDPSLTVVVISHDRMFVDNVCTTAIWELDGSLHHYPPGYDSFLSEKAARLSSEQHQFDSMRKALKKELEWLRKQPRARGTKNKVRVSETLKLQDTVRGRKHRADGRTAAVRTLQASNARLGGEVVKLDNITVVRGDKTVVEDFTYTFERGERVGIVGGNGVGKSSLLRAIAGNLHVQSGAVHVGDTVVFGHFEQEGIDLSQTLSEASIAMLGAKSVEDMRVMDYVNELVARFGHGAGTGGGPSLGSVGSDVGDAESRVNAELENLSYSVSMPVSRRAEETQNNWLTKMTPLSLLNEFGFSREKQHNVLGHLSGGERRRLQLMGLLLKNPNFLMLDEVSNDLDINTLTMVEEVLVEYSGVLLLCSHDRFMLDRLVNHLLVVEGDGTVQLVEGKFTDYLNKQKELREKSKRARALHESGVNKQRREEQKLQRQQEQQQEKDKGGKEERTRKLSFKEKKEYERLEEEIDGCQSEYDGLSERLTSEGGQGQVDYEDMRRWSEQLAKLEQEIEVKMTRWLELAERL